MKLPTPRMQMSMKKKSWGLLAVVMFDMLMICLFTLVYRVKFRCSANSPPVQYAMRPDGLALPTGYTVVLRFSKWSTITRPLRG
jgi:hypothetical protein